MKKILVTSTSLRVGGLEKSLVNLVNYLSLDFEVDLLLMKKDGSLKGKVLKKVNIIYLEDLTSYSLKLLKICSRFPSVFKKIIKLNKQYDYSLAFNGYNNISDMIAASIDSKNKYIWVHGDYNRRAKINNEFVKQFERMKFKYKFFDKVIFVSNGAYKSFKEIYKEKFEYSICYNLIDVPDGNKQTSEHEKLKIVGIGRLVDLKNFNLFIDVIAELRKTDPVSACIVGGGPLKEELQEKINNENLTNDIKLTGNLLNPYDIIASADILLSTSKIEGFGLTFLEALHFGLPSVLPNLSSRIDLENIAPKKSLFFTNNKVENIIEQIHLAKNQKNTFDFSIDKYNEQTIKMIDRIIKKGE